MVTSEAVPFCKTGGLADVCGSLPKYLASSSQRITVILPKYKSIDEKKFGLKESLLKCTVDNNPVIIYETELNNVKFLFIKNDSYFNRDQLYGTPQGDYEDNIERFAFFSKAATAIIHNLKPNIVHCHDWQASLVPVYLKLTDTKIPTVFTIHNLAYQGLFDQSKFGVLSLPSSLFQITGLEFYEKINLLKGGIIFSNITTTVSKKYAEEIQTEEFGCGLHGVLAAKEGKLFGILNGVDYMEWSPDVDKLIPYRYTYDHLENKKKNKNMLATEFGFSKNVFDYPCIGFVGRLSEQKGLDILTEALPNILDKLNATFIFLGTGEERYHKKLENLQTLFPNKIKIKIAFDNRLAHLIEAGSDMFLMPSRYEPCGLNQIYSLRYGTIPIVRKTGGLDDTIIDYTEDKLTSTGFKFTDYTKEALQNVILNAVEIYNDKYNWYRLMQNAMRQDFSWEKQVLEYIKIYSLAMK
jgi:starch synthase